MADSSHDALTGAIDAARAGADWAWTLIYDELSPSVLGYLRARGAAEPEDLTGEVFLQAVRDLPRFEGSGKDLRAWIFTIAHHRFLDERRRSKRRPSDPVPVEAMVERATTADTEAEAIANLSRAEVAALLDRLVPAQREVLLLRIVGGLTIEEIATAVHKRPGAVKALQRRGLAALRRELERGGVPL
jgi:RNA polymerase sigma-70 factor (ECF subfamily)